MNLITERSTTHDLTHISSSILYVRLCPWYRGNSELDDVVVCGILLDLKMAQFIMFGDFPTRFGLSDRLSSLLPDVSLLPTDLFVVFLACSGRGRVIDGLMRVSSTRYRILSFYELTSFFRTVNMLLIFLQSLLRSFCPDTTNFRLIGARLLLAVALS